MAIILKYALGSMCTKITELFLSDSAVWGHGLCIFNLEKRIKVFGLAHLQTEGKMCNLLQRYEDYNTTTQNLKFAIW